VKPFHLVEESKPIATKERYVEKEKCYDDEGQ